MENKRPKGIKTEPVIIEGEQAEQLLEELYNSPERTLQQKRVTT